MSMDYSDWIAKNKGPQFYKQMIGDGVYIRFDGEHLILTANSPTTDTIYLDHHVRSALVQAIQQLDNIDTEESA